MNQIASDFSLNEPSLADAVRMIGADESIASAKRSQWLCSIRRIADWIGRPMEVMPARLTSLRHPVARLHAARLGIAPKTLANHKSNVKAALNHLSQQGLTLSRGAPLSPVWDVILQRVDDKWARTQLHTLFRYLSARGLGSDAINDEVLNDFFEHRARTTFLAVTPAHRREVVRAWNACVDKVTGFPQNRLAIEPLKAKTKGPEWEAFAQSFRDEIETYLETLRRPHRSASGRRRAGCKSSTINTRRRELMAAARMAVACGVPVETFTSLRDLVNPDTAGKVLDSYWTRNGDRPNNHVIDLSWKLLSIAQYTGGFSDEELEQLDDMRFALEQHRRTGLTEKNMTVVRAVLASDIWTRIVRLSDRLMADARKIQFASPMKAAVLAELAVAIRILTYAPVRISNLASIGLDTNLIRPGSIEEPYWLVFPDYDVKNNTDLTFVFDQDVSDFIEQFVRDFRPTLLRRSNHAWLFPGGRGDGRPKSPSTLSDQITKRILKELGFRITAHQFRHAAAAIILKNQPGNFELVRRILGHRNIQTTIGFYVGLETLESSKQFGDLILKLGEQPNDEED